MNKDYEKTKQNVYCWSAHFTFTFIMPFGIDHVDGAAILQLRDIHFYCGIAQFTAKQLSHFVKTDFDQLSKACSKQLIWNN